MTERFSERYLYGGTHIPTLDDNSKDIKPINIKVDNSDNVLMDTSIKRVMQKNRELHKQLIQDVYFPVIIFTRFRKIQNASKKTYFTHNTIKY